MHIPQNDPKKSLHPDLYFVCTETSVWCDSITIYDVVILNCLVSIVSFGFDDVIVSVRSFGFDDVIVSIVLVSIVVRLLYELAWHYTIA